MTTWPGTPDLSLTDLLVVILPRTRAEAMTIDRLARECHASRRDVETTLQELGSSGRWPLCAATSKPAGIWLGSSDDVREYGEALKGRLETQRKRLIGLQLYLRNLPQPQLWDREEAA